MTEHEVHNFVDDLDDLIEGWIDSTIKWQVEADFYAGIVDPEDFKDFDFWGDFIRQLQFAAERVIPAKIEAAKFLSEHECESDNTGYCIYCKVWVEE